MLMSLRRGASSPRGRPPYLPRCRRSVGHIWACKARRGEPAGTVRIKRASRLLMRLIDRGQRRHRPHAPAGCRLDAHVDEVADAAATAATIRARRVATASSQVLTIEGRSTEHIRPAPGAPARAIEDETPDTMQVQTVSRRAWIHGAVLSGDITRPTGSRRRPGKVPHTFDTAPHDSRSRSMGGPPSDKPKR